MINVCSSLFIITLLTNTFCLNDPAFLKKVLNSSPPTYESSLIDSNEQRIDHVGGVDLSNLQWIDSKIDAQAIKGIDPVTKNKNCDQYFSKWCALTCNFKFNKNQQYCSFNDSIAESTCCCAFDKDNNKCTKLTKH